MKLRVTQIIVVVHRWLGVVLCLFMAAWFASGIVLIYVPFPALSAEERIASRSAISGANVSISPVEVIANVDHTAGLDGLRLLARNGRAVYVVDPRGDTAVSVWADSGDSASVVDENEVKGIVSEFSNSPVRNVEGPVEYDQWIVHQSFDTRRPFYRVILDDEDGTELYVSQRTGEIVQRTRQSERFWNYLGAVVHWIYPTVLRRNWAAWDQVVWWLSLAAIVATVLGIWLGIDRMRLAIRANKGSIFLYRGWMRWHHILGVVGGFFLFTWILSGWLSMDHGRLLSVPNPQSSQIESYRGISIVEAASKFDVSFIQGLGNFKELKMSAIDNVPFAVRYSSIGTRIYSPTSQLLNDKSSVATAHIMGGVKRTWPGTAIRSVGPVASDDTYTQLRNSGLPDTALRLVLDDDDSTWVHIDAASGEIISIMDKSRRLNRWLFNGLHSFDFPGLTSSRPLWDVIVVSLMCLGLTFSITGVCLGYRRLRRHL